jgi:hypothetical protein
VNPGALWALPSPFDAIAVGCAVLVNALWWAARRATGNVAGLGPWWPAAYWLAVAGSWWTGSVGVARLRVVRRGADFFEFDPRRGGGSWAGAPVAVIRWQVALEAWVAGIATVGGYGLCLALLVVGVLWDWLLTVAAALVLAAAARARWLNRTAWWEQP